MRKQPSLFLFASLLPVTLMLATATSVAAQDSHDHAAVAEEGPAGPVRTMRWSDPAAWPDGRVPAAGDAVTIARDMAIVLDITPPALRSLTVDGKLTFSDEIDIALETDWIYLRRG